MLKLVRYSSSLIFWAKTKGGRAVKVNAAGCKDVSDLTEVIKKKLPRELNSFDPGQLTLHRSMEEPAFEPDLQISSISAAGSSSKMPLIVKPFDASTVKADVVIASNISQSFKNDIVKDILKLEGKEREIKSKEREIKSRAREIKSKEEQIQLLENINATLLFQKEQETLYKLHYQQLLTVRGLVELYEKNFGERITKKNTSRVDKWKEFLSSRYESFAPFKAAGFTIDQVCHHVDMIFKSHSADIHSIKIVEGLKLQVRGKLTNEQMKVLKVIVESSIWKDIIVIE